MLKKFNKKYLAILIGSLMIVTLISSTLSTFAVFNKQINYQGKLTLSSGVAVADGTYNMEFKLYTTPSLGTAVWTETRIGANKVQVTNGLFSVMLGSVSSLAGVDFNQTLYLGVNIGGTGTPGWDGEMSPRKILGTTPAAITAENVGGFFPSQAATGNEIPVLSGGALTLGDTDPTISATGANTLTFQNVGATGNIQFFSNANTISSNGDMSLASSITAPAIYGSSASSGNLTLSSTSSGTKGKILFGNSGYDEVNNRLGIGTTTPTSPFQVSTSITGASVANTYYGAEITPTFSQGSTGNDLMVGLRIAPTFTGTSNQWNAKTALYLDAGSGSSYAIRGRGSIYLDGGGNYVSANENGMTWGSSSTQLFGAGNSNNTDHLNFVTNYTTRIYIDGSGNVGIGTTTPTTKLDVAGDINTTGKVRVNGTQTIYIPGGNFTGTMYIGDGGSALSYTSGSDGKYNTAVGFSALQNNTTGYSNSAQGSYALYSLTTGYYNNGQGYGALYYTTSGTNNNAQGTYALHFNTGNHNNAQGSFVLHYNTSGSENTAQGSFALYNINGWKNVAIGAEAGYGGVSGNTNIINGNSLLGYKAGHELLTGADYNTLLGYASGDNITTGARNIIIGYNVDAPSATGNDQLNIGNAIYGDLASGNVGIGTATPTAKLDVAGDIHSNRGLFDSYVHISRSSYGAGFYLTDQSKGTSDNSIGIALNSTGGLTVNTLTGGLSEIAEILTIGRDGVLFLKNNAILKTNTALYFDNGSNDYISQNSLPNTISHFINNSEVLRVGVSNVDVFGNLNTTGTLTVGAYTLPATDGTANQVLQTNGSGAVSWATVSGGGGGSSSWGSITGTLSSQTDLQSALNSKQDTLVSGTNIKTIGGTSILGSGNIALPSKTSDLTNDSGFITGNQTITLSGDITGSGNTSITTSIGTGKVTNAMLAGSISVAKMSATGTPSATTYLRGDGSWSTPVNTTYSVISSAEIINTGSTTAGLITGQRAEDLMVNEATKARTLTNKNLTSGTNTFPVFTDANIANASTWNAKQDALVSGTNIKTINGTSLLGSGDLSIASSQWTTSGSDIYYNSGNVGIGNISPTAKLDVTGSGLFTSTNTSDGNSDVGTLKVISNNSVDTQGDYYRFGDTYAGYFSSDSSVASDYGGKNIGIYATATGNGYNNYAAFLDGRVKIGGYIAQLELGDLQFQTQEGSLSLKIGPGSLPDYSYNSLFFGYNSALAADNVHHSFFVGDFAGYSASGANNSYFVGDHAGYYASDSVHSNFFGYAAGLFANNSSYSTIIGYQAGASTSGPNNGVGNNNIIIGTNITLPTATANAMNLGGVLFATGTHSSTTGAPSAAPAVGGKIGIGTVTPTEALSLVGNMAITGNIVPTADNTYSLGTATYMWKDVYIGPGSLYVNGKKVIEDISNTITISTNVDQNLSSETEGVGNNTLRAKDTGNVSVLTNSGNIDINSTSGNINLGTTGTGNLNLGTIKSGVWNGTAITDAYIASASAWNAKQGALVSGTNIKTINGQSILGSGDLVIASGSSSAWTTSGSNIYYNTGNVGIGTTTPVTGLDINFPVGSGKGLAVGGVYPSWMGDNGIYLTGSFRANVVLVNDGAGMGWGNSSTAIYAASGSYGYLIAKVNNKVPFKIGSNGDIGMGGEYDEGNNIIGSSVLYVSKDNSRVGINTTTPAYPLDVAGDINTTGKVRIGGTQAIYIPGGNFTGTMYVGNGGSSLLFSSGDDGKYNTSVGIDALLGNTKGNYNTALGNAALKLNTTGNYNSAVGSMALYSNTTGYGNIAFGWSSLYSNTTGWDNVASGVYSSYSNTTGSSNTAIGNYALYSNTTGYNNVAIGSNALYRLKAGNENVAIGRDAGYSVSNAQLYGNTLIGYQSGRSLKTNGSYNTLIGDRAGDDLTTGARNIIIGYNTDAPSATGNDQLNIGNTIYGDLATGNIGIGITNASANFQVGLASVTTGNAPTTLNENAYYLGLGGAEYNTNSYRLMGFGYTLNTYTHFPAYVGYQEKSSAGSTNGDLIFGTRSVTTDTAPSERMRILASGLVGIGNDTPSYLFHVGSSSVSGVVARFENSSGTCDINPTTSSLACSSDLNLKKNITLLNNQNIAFSLQNNIDTANKSVLDKIMALTPVQYNWLSETNASSKHTGLIAQEVEQLFPDLVSTDSKGLKSLNYAGLSPILVSAIQEMNLKVTGIADITKTNTWRDSIINWLASATNGINKLFAGEVKTNKLCVSKSDGSDICLTGDQLDSLFNSKTGQTNVITVPAPTVEEPPLSDTDQTPAPASEENPTSTPESESEAEPNPEPETEPDTITENIPAPSSTQDAPSTTDAGSVDTSAAQ